MLLSRKTSKLISVSVRRALPGVESASVALLQKSAQASLQKCLFSNLSGHITTWVHCIGAVLTLLIWLHATPCHNHASVTLQVAYASDQLQMEDILESIRDAGFEADLLSSKSAEPSGKVCQAQSIPAKVAHPHDTVEATMVYTMSPMPKVASGLTQLGVLQISKFRVTGMHCSSCSTAVQKALSVTPGVERASVSLTLEQAEVVYDPGLVKEVSQQPKSQPKCNNHCNYLRLAYWQYAVHVCIVTSSQV